MPGDAEEGIGSRNAAARLVRRPITASPLSPNHSAPRHPTGRIPEESTEVHQPRRDFTRVVHRIIDTSCHSYLSEESVGARGRRCHFSSAVQNSYSVAQMQLRVLYLSGVGVEKSQVEALRLLHMAADQGQVDAQSSLGQMHGHGAAMVQSFEEAARFNRLAADQGNADAQCRLGLVYLEGRGVVQSDKDAVRLFRLAVAKGDGAVRSNLITLMDEGRAE